MLKKNYIFFLEEGYSYYMKLDHFNSIRKSGRSIDASNVTKSLTVQTVAKLKLLLKNSPRLRKYTAHQKVPRSIFHFNRNHVLLTANTTGKQLTG